MAHSPMRCTITSCGSKFSVSNGEAWEKVLDDPLDVLPGLLVHVQRACVVQAVKFSEAGEHNALHIGVFTIGVLLHGEYAFLHHQNMMIGIGGG